MASARSADGVIPANEGGFDFESFRLRSFAAELEAIGELERSNCSRLSEVAAAIDGNARAVIFEGLSGVDHPLIGNVMGTRARLARALAPRVRARRPAILAWVFLTFATTPRPMVNFLSA